jgi:hypothetical protein
VEGQNIDTAVELKHGSNIDPHFVPTPTCSHGSSRLLHIHEQDISIYKMNMICLPSSNIVSIGIGYCMYES